jgi:hypothetical protein
MDATTSVRLNHAYFCRPEGDKWRIWFRARTNETVSTQKKLELPRYR